MTNKINSVTNIVEYRTDTYDLGENFILEVFYENGTLKSQKLKKSENNPKFDEYKYEHYPVLIDDISSFKQRIENIKFYETVGNGEYWWEKHIVKNVLETIENGTFDIENLIYICIYDHSFRDREFKKFRHLKHFGYIGGLNEWSDDDYPDCKHRFDWKKLGKYLKNHKNVKNLKEIEIPSYNADFYGQKAYEMDVLMEPEWGKVDYLFIEGHIDPLGVSQFLIKKKK